VFVECKVPKLIFETRVLASVQKVWEFHQSVEALTLLTPPGMKPKLLGDEREVRDGALHKVQVRKFGVPMEIHARISEVEPFAHFRDTQERGPFGRWTHSHRFISLEKGTLIRDEVDYEAPGGIFAPLLDRLVVRNDILNLWEYRQKITYERLGKLSE
jgi:ligand-binding SRPBCC domain-containing protein